MLRSWNSYKCTKAPTKKKFRLWCSGFTRAHCLPSLAWREKKYLDSDYHGVKIYAIPHQNLLKTKSFDELFSNKLNFCVFSTAKKV